MLCNSSATMSKPMERLREFSLNKVYLINHIEDKLNLNLNKCAPYVSNECPGPGLSQCLCILAFTYQLGGCQVEAVHRALYMGRGVELACSLCVCHSFQITSCSPTQTLPEPCPLGVFGGFVT